MNFIQALKTLPNDPLKFSGTATRSEYWWKNLIIIIALPIMLGALYVTVALFGFLGSLSLDPDTVGTAVIMVLILGQIAVTLLTASITLPLTVRRIKDTGQSGWWIVPIYLAFGFAGATGAYVLQAAILQILFFLYCGFMPTAAALQAASSETSGFEIALEEDPT